MKELIDCQLDCAYINQCLYSVEEYYKNSRTRNFDVDSILKHFEQLNLDGAIASFRNQSNLEVDRYNAECAS